MLIVVEKPADQAASRFSARRRYTINTRADLFGRITERHRDVSIELSTQRSISRVDAVQVHYLDPCRNKITYKFLLCIVSRIDFRDRA